MTDTATASQVHPFSSHAPVFLVESRTQGDLGRDLLRLDVREGTLGLRTMVAHFHAVGPQSDGSVEQLSYLDGKIVDLGKKLTVNIGPASGERRVFAGTVSAIEASFDEGQIPYVSFFAEDALMRLRMRERTETYTNVSDAKLVKDIATKYSMRAEADAEGPTYPVVQQWEESDLAFLRNRAVRINAELWVDGDDVIHFSDREQRPGVELELVQGNELIAVQARADLADQRATVQFRGWDHGRVETIAELAGGDIVAAEISGGRTGPQVVAGVFEQTALSRARRDVLSVATAQSYAQAEMRRRARGFVCVEGLTSGTPDLVPGARLTLRRVGRPFEGDGYRVTFAHHSFDLVTGYRTRFRAERAAVGR
jgi:phage protein D